MKWVNNRPENWKEQLLATTKTRNESINSARKWAEVGADAILLALKSEGLEMKGKTDKEIMDWARDKAYDSNKQGTLIYIS